jgi:hypothetical protein
MPRAGVSLVDADWAYEDTWDDDPWSFPGTGTRRVPREGVARRDERGHDATIADAEPARRHPEPYGLRLATAEPATAPVETPLAPTPRAPERRTITIQGRGAERNRPPSRRPRRPMHERSGFRPDRTAMWAVLLGLLLVLAAATSSRAAPRTPRPAPAALTVSASTGSPSGSPAFTPAQR